MTLWCLCGVVIRDGNCFDPATSLAVAGPLTERINPDPISQLA